LKTLFELCKPRDSVFDLSKTEDVLDLSDLMQNKINAQDFFEQNYLTTGMQILFDEVFNRLHRRGGSSIIKLTQTMGGGKTHSMIALGLLAKNPELRSKFFGDKFKDSALGKINVVAFTGRESDVPFGIWGYIAEQLNKKDLFKEYYSPLSAPGQSAWINLLKGEPLLILLDELPPYLENAKSKSIGDSNLAVVTTTALANLFSALNKEELSNIALVISDLKAVYESGSEFLQSAFKELDSEVSRYAKDIEPVGSTTDDVYEILKKRLFKVFPQNNSTDIIEIANAYKNSVYEAKQMGYTNYSPDQIYLGIKDTYPFHPSIRDLYARFKENKGFQQTRGIIRLMRKIVSQLYSGENPKAKSKYLINVHDFDLNDNEMLSMVIAIKPSLNNAISKDIASHGKSTSEIIDLSTKSDLMQNFSKIILVSSLSDVPNSILGLTFSEAVAYLCEPQINISNLKLLLEEFELKAWYLFKDRDGRILFKNTKNLIAEINSMVDSYDNEMAKKELKVFLYDKFKPIGKDCYQEILVFPALDEINLSPDKVTLVLFEPTITGDLSNELRTFYENNVKYKNRIMFLTGQKNAMDNLIKAAKELKAINAIIARFQDEKVPENDSQFIFAREKFDKYTMNLLSSAKETFVTLFYPIKNNEFSKADFFMEFSSNNYNGEEQIRDLLESRMKFTKDTSSPAFRSKLEERIFTQKEMRWIDIKERAATNTSWQWHIPGALENLRDEMLKKEIWKMSGDYIDKGPFEKPKTSVNIYQKNRDETTGEVTLEIKPLNGDKVFYGKTSDLNSISNSVTEFNNFKTSELFLYFICIDTTGEHETGDPILWKNKVEIKHRFYDENGKKKVEIRAIPEAPIKFTTDGSNPKEYGIKYENEFVVPEDSKLIQVVTDLPEYFNEIERIPVEKGPSIEIEKSKPLILLKKIKADNTRSVYEMLEELNKFNAIPLGITLYFNVEEGILSQNKWIEVNFGEDLSIKINKIEEIANLIRDNIMQSFESSNVTFEAQKINFETGEDFLNWLAEKKMELKDFAEGKEGVIKQ